VHSASLLFSRTRTSLKITKDLSEKDLIHLPQETQREGETNEALISETEIGHHSIMIKNLPKDLSRNDAEIFVRNKIE